ncbi:hypothetical protein AAMO2058_001651800 [Amorphochlora amoebiformis]
MAQEYLGLMAPTRRRKARIRVLALALIASALVLTISVAKFQLSLRSGVTQGNLAETLESFNSQYSANLHGLQLRGGGQLSLPEPEDAPVAPKPQPATAKAVGFFPEIGKVANSLLKFGGVDSSKMNVSVKTDQKGLKLTGLAMPAYPQESSVLKVKGEGKKGQFGYWLGADLQKQKFEGGVGAKHSLGEGKTLDLYLTTVLPKPKSLEAEAKYTDSKLKASLRLPTLTTKSSGAIEGSLAIQANPKLKFVGAGVVNPQELSLAYLKKTSALGAQYKMDDYTISASTEAMGAASRATVSTKIGDEELALAATMSGMGHNPALHAGIKTTAPYGVTAKAGISTNGDVDLELSRPLVDRLSLRLGAKTNMNNLSAKPKFGAQLNVDAAF